MKKIFKISLGIVLVLLLIQLIPVDNSNPQYNPKEHFTYIYKTPNNIEVILKRACYDCHSNQVKYPDYAAIAPISWVVRSDVKKGRSHLNFSEWGSYNNYQKESLLKKIPQSILHRTMPMPLYVSYHPEAVLNPEDIALLSGYFEQLEVR